ncbi:protein of unknown function [Cupriavidus taiwanensis]|nr:protein of unknown function [Cupriavidus taiwanensis]
MILFYVTRNEYSIIVTLLTITEISYPSG